ncbi:hypothetical protein VTO42DRAFT_6914 [Malbranchea cinnamomea]
MSDSDSYNDSHRAFLQALMARGSMTFEEAKPILAEIFSVREGREILPNDISQSDLTHYTATINLAISPFDLEIRSTLHQGTQARVYALVNTTSDPLTQLATTYSADEIAYVKRLLDCMFETNNTRIAEGMCITTMQAMQLARVTSNRTSTAGDEAQQTQGGSAQSLTMKDAEEMLTRLVDEGWFERSRRGYYTLAPRALMELRSWLIATYNDEEDEIQGVHPRARGGKIKMCFACGDIITMGQRCSDRQCLARLHDGCTRNFFRMQQAQKCPVCKKDWTGDYFVGEKALVNRQKSRGGARTSNAGSDGQLDDVAADSNAD